MLLYNRHLRRLRYHQRIILQCLLVLFTLDCLYQIAIRPATVRISAAESPPQRSGSAHNISVYIASVHRNTEDILRDAWNDAILGLVDHLGPENVYVTAIEGGSQDKTKEVLEELRLGLRSRGVGHNVSLGMTVWEQVDEINKWPDANKPRQPGWIWDPEEHHYAVRRIPYLSNVRNEAMAPLKALEKQGRRFDYVFWANDVAFDTSDFLTLLNTRGGNYAAACSMDFKVYPIYYDTFALRDDRGDKPVSYYWPWFKSPIARRAALRNQPIRVESCWNGVVLFDSAPFYANPPLAFRGIDDSLADLHLEGSECCLVHADNPLSAERGVWLNPNVRVGYSVPAYAAVQGTYPGKLAAVTGAWANRWMRWRTWVQFALERREVRKRLREWRAASPSGRSKRHEKGEACLINEKQIMWQNGWKHL